MSQDRIAEFWEWFRDWHLDIATAYTGGEVSWLNLNLSEQVERIEPRLGWEMGPYYHPDNTLVISPSVRDNIEVAQRVVHAAPVLEGWRFLPARPPKVLKRLVMSLPGFDEALPSDKLTPFRALGRHITHLLQQDSQQANG